MSPPRLSGGAEWLHGVGYGHLGELEDEPECGWTTPILADELQDNVAIVAGLLPDDEGEMIEILQGWDRLVLPVALWPRFVREVVALVGGGG